MTKPPTSESSAAAGAVLPEGWMLTCPYPEAMELKFVAPGGGYQSKYYTVRGEGIIYAFLKALHDSTPQPPPEAGSVGVPEGWQLVPKVATKEMLEAGRYHNSEHIYPAWGAMLAAAPAPKESK